jgi:hypothetical protein
MADIGTLVVKMAADSAQMRSELDRVKKEVRDTGGGIQALSGSIAKVGGIVAGAFSVAAIAGFASRAIDAADNLKDMADQLNISASSLSVMQLAATQSGSSVESINTALQKMTMTIGNAVGGQKAAVQAFSQLGLKFDEIARMRPDEAFGKIADKIAAIENPYQRASAAQAIFGKGAKDIQALLAGGSSAISEVDARLVSMGAKLTEIDISKIAIMKDEAAFAAMSFQNLGTKIIANATPAMGVLLNSFSSLIGSMGGADKVGRAFGIGMVAVIKTVEGVASALFAIFEQIRGVLLTVGSAAMSFVGIFSDGAASIASSMESSANSAFANSTRAATAALSAGRDVFNAAEVFDAEAARLEARARAAASTVTGAVGVATGGGAGGGAGGKAELTPAERREKYSDELAAKFKREYDLTAMHFSSLEMLAVSHADILAGIDANATAQRIQTASDFQYLQSDIQRAFGLQQLDFEAIKNSSIIDLAGEMFSALGGAGTKFFKVQQGFAIANAIINTAQGITEALKLPFPASLAAAAKVAAAGAIQIAKIKATNPGGSGGVATGGLGGGSSAAVPAAQQPVGNAAQAEQAPRIAQVVINGNLFSSRETADWLIGQLSDAINDRDVVFINGNSRQAGLLAGG